ncbi:MAG TPA: hypothetical protein VGM66_08205 [Candidatus Udaeobacter sp.]|jgi:hypothetical protein
MTASVLSGIAFVVMWIGVMALLSHMSGWPKLAAVYRARRPPSGTCFLLAGGKIGDVWYRGTLTIYTSPEGLYISLWPIFRFREPPLFIPWHDIRNRREKRWLWSGLIEFDVGSPPIGTMRLLSVIFRDAPNV